MKPIADADIRQRVLAINESFIVQAPAGSGKTELLTQRLLKLLAVVKHPEEIIAITFTRKAAAEMRARVVDALKLACCDTAPSEPHKQTTYHLARAALTQDKKNHWQLLSNSNRLRIITIDSLASFICRHMPLASGIDANIQVADQPATLYRQAIQQLYQQAERDEPLSQAITHCLIQLDNVMPYFETLLMQMLAKRDQWLVHIMPHYTDRENLKQLLESSLQHVVQQTQQRINDLISEAQQQTLSELLCFAMQNTDPESEIPSDLNNMAYWRAVSDLFLTQKNTWRSQITKRNGFPADKKAQKQQWKDCLAELQQSDALLAALIACRQCPPSHYNAQQWQILDSLLTLLPQLVAQLQLVFSQHRQLDFIEITLAANRALGTGDNPSDLALYLDYKIQHLLIDEFQDTSTTHFRLIEKIIREWVPHDGRSLFLVGDPMQSIYRFRQAEVGLFVHTQRHGIAQMTPEPVALVSNFRSNACLVDWFNQTFHSVFPNTADIDTGAINYHKASPCIPTHEAHGVQTYLLEESNSLLEANCVVNIIKQLDDPTESVAILVKSRTQLIEIIPALRAADLAFNAVDIEPLSIQPEITEALILTRALTHLADRIAWLALLRSPCCGLQLADLLVLCQSAQQRPLWLTLINTKQLPHLSTDAQQRLQCVTPQLQNILQQQGRTDYANWIKTAWQQLGFNKLYNSPVQQQNINTYFDIIYRLYSEHGSIDLSLLENQLAQSYTRTPNDTPARIHIMTIHKSKGLEFDHVIMPNLERGPVRDRPSLLLWLERNQGQMANELLLAPIKSPEQDADAIYQYCQRVEQQKLDYENARLLYVAVTRAKQSLHLVATSSNKPKNGSFYQLLHASIQPDATTIEIDEANEEHSQDEPRVLQRLEQLPQTESEAPMRIKPDIAVIPQMTLSDYEVSQQLAPLTGTIIHQQLYQLAKNHLSRFKIDNIVMQCRQLGLTEQQIAHTLPTITTALNNTLQDQKGQWILGHHHDDHFEYSIKHRNQDKLNTYIIDRCFIDNGVRWIVDYKSSQPHSDQSADAFICAQKEQYFEQLNTYATLMSEIEPIPIRCGLYFPLCSLWTEWSYEKESLTVE